MHVCHTGIGLVLSAYVMTGFYKCRMRNGHKRDDHGAEDLLSIWIAREARRLGAGFRSDTRPALPLKRAPMEPTHPSEAPRPKGFLRRNWLALLFYAFFQFLTVFDFWWEKPTSDSGIAISTYRGNIWVRKLVWGRDHFTYRFVRPAFGHVPSVNVDGDRWEILIPLWLPILIPVSWIAFREWRRKRAVEGKSRPH
jgi:hypothetical protein